MLRFIRFGKSEKSRSRLVQIEKSFRRMPHNKLRCSGDAANEFRHRLQGLLSITGA
jgi:hypothetical protein